MRYCVIDVETMGSEDDLKAELNCQKFTVGEILKDTGGKEVFTNPNLMAKRLIEMAEQERKRNGRLYVYGWNTQYDFYAIFRDYLKESPIIEFPNGKMIKYFSFYPFMAMYGKQDGWKFKADAYFLDMMAFFRMSLKEFGEITGIPKKDMPSNPKTVKEIEPYLHRDCEITIDGFKKIKKIVNELGFYPKRYITAGNVAIMCFLTWCKNKGTRNVFSWQGKTYQGENIGNFRNAFRGGRFECFQTGEFEDCIKIDCNAMYPYLMKEMDFPHLKYEYYTEDKDKIMESINSKIGVVKCRIKSPKELKFGYLPIRIGDMTYYPLNKELDGMWTTLEIRKAMNLGYKIIELKEAVYFNKAKINPFKDYMEHLWNIRKEKKGVEKEVIKLLMNSLFGKWSQYRVEEDIKIISRDNLNEYLSKGYKFMKTAQEKYIVHREKEAKMPRYANPMISIWITAMGRDYLYDTMMKLNKKDLIYVATDGLIIRNCKEIENIKIGNDIGEFKIEDKGKCKMLGENRYKFNKTIKIGGIPKKDINEDVLDGKRIVKSSKMISIKQALNDIKLRDKIGTFQEEEIKISNDNKINIVLPDLIIERDKFERGKYARRI
jgi:hypothetical protein